MKKCKLKIGVSYLVLIIVCLISHQFLLFINYTLAILLHEMAHIYVAGKKGYRVNRLKIDLLGMKLNISQNIDKNDQFMIAIAGPMINFFVCILCCAMWWIVPESFYFTSNFFRANLILAIFNILPIEPLDGGLMLNSLLTKTNKRVKSIILKTINILFVVVFSTLFILSCRTNPDLFYLLFAVFFIVNMWNLRNKDQIDLCYKLLVKKKTAITKINLLKVAPETTLFECFKQIRHNTYTIFYCSNSQPYYITETELNELVVRNDFKTQIGALVLNNKLK